MNAIPRFYVSSRAWFLLSYSLVYAVAMLVLGGATFSELYAPSAYHRLQADAFLDGQLHLADSLYQIRHDLAWHDGQVNHVWGLGVGLWLLPFELLWRLCGQKWFPDRLALGVAFALLAWYSAGAGWRLAERSRKPAIGIGFVWLILLCPAIWTLNQGGRLIYEETSLYACLVSLGIMVAVIRFACFNRRIDFFICAALSAMSALVRPTHGIYGLAGMLVCSVILLARQRRGDSKSAIQKTSNLRFSVRSLVLGNSAFVAGLVFLAATNWLRFGSPTEFGHRLTATPGIIVFMTRIDNPMREASAIEAARELFGWLFLSRGLQKERTRGERLKPWEAPYPRWRDPYMTTFDLSWAVVCATAAFGAMIWILSKNRQGWTAQTFARRPTARMVTATLVWSAFSSGGLVCFYLFFPSLSIRYLLDFAPAFTGLALLAWLNLSHRWTRVSAIVLAAWLGYEILAVEVRTPPTPLRSRAEMMTELTRSEATSIEEFHGSYNPVKHPNETGITYNGYGWDRDDGLAKSIVILALDSPRFIEMVVGPREPGSDTPLRRDVYRAMIDGHFLPMREVREEGKQIRIRFDVPETVQRRTGHELLFLCFSKSYDKTDRESQRPLYLVRWR